ncbi:hypothetical protein S83_054103 [Arachis hypogaea]
MMAESSSNLLLCVRGIFFFNTMLPLSGSAARCPLAALPPLGIPVVPSFHIHALGDTTNGCNSTGPHFNPLNKYHGAPADHHHHAGDLGNILAGPDGVAEISITDSQIPLSRVHSILGRAVVVHADPDDLGRGIEPWTFVQRLGEAVFIPTGCPHQVRNLKLKKIRVHTMKDVVENLEKARSGKSEVQDGCIYLLMN